MKRNNYLPVIFIRVLDISNMLKKTTPEEEELTTTTRGKTSDRDTEDGEIIIIWKLTALRLFHISARNGIVFKNDSFGHPGHLNGLLHGYFSLLFSKKMHFD